MGQADQPAIMPTPTDEETAAILAALAVYLAEQRSPQLAETSPARPWAIAGRLASQGQPAKHLTGIRVTWANVARLARIGSQ